MQQEKFEFLNKGTITEDDTPAFLRFLVYTFLVTDIAALAYEISTGGTRQWMLWICIAVMMLLLYVQRKEKREDYVHTIVKEYSDHFLIEEMDVLETTKEPMSRMTTLQKDSVHMHAEGGKVTVSGSGTEEYIGKERSTGPKRVREKMFVFTSDEENIRTLRNIFARFEGMV